MSKNVKMDFIFKIEIAGLRASIILCVALAAMAIEAAPLRAQSFSVGIEESSSLNDAQVISAPQPRIPPHLQEQCFKSCCIARFIITGDGKSSVKLISSSGCEEVDDLTLSTLKHWKFRPATLNGKPVQSTRKVKIEFEVE